MAAQESHNKYHLNNVYRKMWDTFDKRSAEEHATHLLPHLKQHHHILDVGCGRGSITMDLALLVPEGSVLGIDVNATLVDGAKTQAQARGINISFAVMDANDLSAIESSSYDVIHEHQVLMHLPDPVSIIRELHRILKPGGILSMRDNAILHYYPHLPMQQKYIHTSLSHCRKNSEGPSGDSSQGDGLFFGLWNHSAAQQAGFAPKKIEYSSWGWTWRDPPSWVDMAKKAARPTLLDRGNMTEAELDQAEREWEEWAAMPHARMQGLDGALLCWK